MLCVKCVLFLFGEFLCGKGEASFGNRAGGGWVARLVVGCRFAAGFYAFFLGRVGGGSR